MSSGNAPTHKPFLPGRANVLVPLRPPADGPAALALYSPSRRRAVLARDAAWWLIRITGARTLPWRGTTWRPPMPPATWTGLVTALQRRLGVPTSMAFYRPRDRYRQSFAMLWMDEGAAKAFVKVSPDDSGAGCRPEWTALAAVALATPQVFRAPEPITHIAQEGWQAIAMTALGTARHQPAIIDVGDVASEVSRCLADIPRPDGTAAHWEPMHGDLTPWNLRCVGGASPMLFDWADAGWGPPGADEVLYRATTAAMDDRPPLPWADDVLEARRYWAQEIPRRTTSLDAFNRARLACLETSG